jgi:hypothetical protein
MCFRQNQSAVRKSDQLPHAGSIGRSSCGLEGILIFRNEGRGSLVIGFRYSRRLFWRIRVDTNCYLFPIADNQSSEMTIREAAK